MMRNLVKIIFLLLFSVTTIGCAVVPFIGVATSAYIAWSEGEAHVYYATEGKVAYNAVKRALDDLNYPITKDEDKGDGNYYLVADTNDRFKITIEQVEPYVTQVSIRINVMGDKPYAEMIYKKVETELDVIDYEEHLKKRRLFERN